MITVPQSVKRMAQRFHEAGHELYIVGGAVRDALRNCPVADYDFATSASPLETRALFRRTIPTGIQHGTITVLFERDAYEVTTFRIDGTYSDHRRPDSVTFTRSLIEDLKRRDFTINAIAYDPLTRQIIDPFEGQKDLQRRVIRTVGDPRERFAEDALRMVRAIRFLVTLDFTLDDPTRAAIDEMSSTIGNVAQERIRQELEKMMAAERPSRGWILLNTTGLLPHIIPELLEDTENNYQERHGPPIFPHLTASCDCAPQNSPVLRWAALLHDIGKPRALGEDEKGIHFHSHDTISADMTVGILERLRFPKDFTNEVAHLVRHHMFGYDPSWSDAAVRRLISRVGEEQVFLLTALRRIDGCGKGGGTGNSPVLIELERRIHTLLEERPPLGVADLAIGGKDLMEALNVPPGPHIGIILRELLQTVIEDPTLNTPDRLLIIAKRFYDERLNVSQ